MSADEVKAETGGSSLHSIVCKAKPNQVRDTQALNPNGGVANSGHGLVNANCTHIYIAISYHSPHCRHEIELTTSG